MNAIPTKYDGVQFRSRLEARWAAFFDIVDWKWDYEPIDLAGYIPDFISGTTLIEVKPIVIWPCPVIGCTACNDKPRADYDAAVEKILGSNWFGQSGLRTAVLVGAVPYVGRDLSGEFPSLGRVVDSDFFMPGYDFDFDVDDLVSSWREAGNRVQWRKPR